MNTAIRILNFIVITILLPNTLFGAAADRQTSIEKASEIYTKGKKTNLTLYRAFKPITESIKATLEPSSSGGYVFNRNERKPNEVAECNLYKIHLMPKTYDFGFVYDVTKIMEENTELNLENNPKIFGYKFIGKNFNSDEPVIQTNRRGQSEVMPTAVIYIEGKESAQKALNALYNSLTHIPGSGIRPRYNAKVTDLIWVAQGNSDEKKIPGAQQFYDSDLIYCSPYMGLDNSPVETPIDHYLYHPETGEPLTSTGE